MPPKKPRVFLDTSVIIAALMSPAGGARALFHLSHAGSISLLVSHGVLQEAEEVMRRKASGLVGLLAHLLDEANVEMSTVPTSRQRKVAHSLLSYSPDASILAQAVASQCDWFVTHDKEHFLGNPALNNLPLKIGTPGNLITWLREKME
jgi:putative PIN family toxin of toxin-antitoxin system